MNDSLGRAIQNARPTLRISYDADTDVLLALTPTAVIDGALDHEADELLDGLFVYRRPAGELIGFACADACSWDVFANDEAPEIWDALRFVVPTLGLADASIGEIVLAAQGTFSSSTPDVVLFDRAVEASDRGDWPEAESWWRLCLATGDLRAHFGLGYTLVELGRPRQAFGHLRVYTELVPSLSWAWLWRGRAAQGMDELDEARHCYEQAVDAEASGSEETDAAERLARLSI
jgi:tetratricopeptide (TPR) repeat protein